MVSVIVDEGWSVAAAAERFGVGAKTVPYVRERPGGLTHLVKGQCVPVTRLAGPLATCLHSVKQGDPAPTGKD